LLVLSGLPKQRWYLVELADAIARQNCLVTLAVVLPEDAGIDRIRSARDAVRGYLNRQGVQALVKVVTASDPFKGGRDMVNTYGFGPLKPNTFLMGETEAPSHFIEYARLIRQITRRQRNLVIVRESGRGFEPDAPDGPRMDVWWRGKGPNAGLMLTLAHLLCASPEWKGVRLSLNVIVQNEGERAGMTERLARFIEESRLDAGFRVIEVADNGDWTRAIRAHSHDARMVFLGLRAPEEGEEDEAYSRYYEHLLKITADLPLTALVLANEKVDFLRIFK
jgi:hypothetical protein